MKFTKEKLAAVIAQGEREFRDALFEEDEEEAARVLKVATDPIKRRIDFVKRQLDYLDEEAHAAEKSGHLGSGQRQHERLVDQEVLGRELVALLEVVAEPVGCRLEWGEGLDFSLLLGGIGAPRREGDLHVVAGLLRRVLDRRAAAQHDQVGQRDR